MSDKPYDLPAPKVVADMCAIHAWREHLDDDSRLLHEMAADTIRHLMARCVALASKLELTEARR